MQCLIVYDCAVVMHVCRVAFMANVYVCFFCVRDAGAVCTLGVGIIGLFAHVQKNVMSDPECVPEEIGRPKTKTATSMSLGASVLVFFYLLAFSVPDSVSVVGVSCGDSSDVLFTWRSCR